MSPNQYRASVQSSDLEGIRLKTGIALGCFYDEAGLLAAAWHPSMPAAPIVRASGPVKMCVITAPDKSNDFQTYIESLGLVADTDFVRHGGGGRGGIYFFDILDDLAIDRLRAASRSLLESAEDKGEDASISESEGFGAPARQSSEALAAAASNAALSSTAQPSGATRPNWLSILRGHRPTETPRR